MQRAKPSSSRHSNRSVYLFPRRGRSVSSFAAQTASLLCAFGQNLKRSQHICTWHSPQRVASKSKLSIARLCSRVAKTMVRRVFARSTTQTTMQHSSLVRMGTTSKPFATNQSPNPSLHPTCYSGLNPPPLAGELQR